MKILIDIKHPAQLNLFKGLAIDLRESGWDVTISYLGRGKVPSIIRKEYPDFNTGQIGGSSGSKWSIIWEGNIRRTSAFLRLIRQHRYNIVIAASSVPLALAARLTGTPVIQFYDDIERGMVNKLNAWLSDKIFFPPFIAPTSKMGVFNCLKEWSYLSPRYFRPDDSILKNYGLREREYIFVREVSNKSFNYYDQQDAIISSFASRLPKNIKVVLSLEDKTLIPRYPADWIILEEPVSDIHSLMYYSRLVLSSGDSMAREGAMLGVPGIYCGFRDMKANHVLIKEQCLFHAPGADSASLVDEFASKPFEASGQLTVRNKLLEKWDDMKDFMKARIEDYKLKG